MVFSISYLSETEDQRGKQDENNAWFSDGVGLFGSITPSLKYEAYLATGLDGSGFDAVNGIREGRIEGTPSLHQPSFTGRLDYYPFAERTVPYGQTLRLGASTHRLTSAASITVTTELIPASKAISQSTQVTSNTRFRNWISKAPLPLRTSAMRER
jgi:hypothetical protein